MKVTGFHAHIYFPAADAEAGAACQQQVRERFGGLVTVGRFHAQPVGPHPVAMFQVAFPAGHLEALVTWLMEHREGRSILVHPLTGDELADHRDHALWLGPPLPLDLAALDR
jgi:DOPA 4,5-dioxygenase